MRRSVLFQMIISVGIVAENDFKQYKMLNSDQLFR